MRPPVIKANVAMAGTASFMAHSALVQSPYKTALFMANHTKMPSGLVPSTVYYWRVRLAILDKLPMLGTQLGPDFFKEKLMPLCMQGLKDPVANIRKAATVSLSDVVSFLK